MARGEIKSLDHLPLYADESLIAAVVLGPQRAGAPDHFQICKIASTRTAMQAVYTNCARSKRVMGGRYGRSSGVQCGRDDPRGSECRGIARRPSTVLQQKSPLCSQPFRPKARAWAGRCPVACLLALAAFGVGVAR
jgi:hypothetical protein